MTPRVAGLFVYPVKSCGRIALERAEVEELGIRSDRRWMVVDERGRFLTSARFRGWRRSAWGSRTAC